MSPQPEREPQIAAPMERPMKTIGYHVAALIAVAVIAATVLGLLPQ
jgi:hypothetical protein